MQGSMYYLENFFLRRRYVKARFISKVLPKCFSSEWSMAQFRVPDYRCAVSFGKKSEPSNDHVDDSRYYN